ncbi:FUSC family protein [Cysteiniphilum halobium]|uniref:FUSC family protein n=1 Tax=Cysteiniphilum halobium TaxID=2219059 RepID=UPI000E64E053|nr:FUSC family protein [Cysteiniphilum halobium]
MHKIFNYSSIVKMLIAVVPATILSYFLSQPIYLICGLYAAAVIIPFCDHSSKRIAFVMLIFLFGITFALVKLLAHSDFYFIAIVSIIAVMIGIIETYNTSFKSMGAYLFIGIIYTAFETRAYSDLITITMMAKLFGVSLLSIVIVFLINLRTQAIKGYQNFTLQLQSQHSLHYCVYFLPILASMLVWHFLQLAEPQWLLWSSLSVASLSFKKARDKIQKRITGACIGLSLGIIVTLLFNLNSPLIFNLSFIGIILSLRGLKNYTASFAIRCFFIVIFAGAHFLYTSSDRIVDVFIGGLIGLISSAILNYFIQRQHNKILH